jgi:hypothetical protein
MRRPREKLVASQLVPQASHPADHTVGGRVVIPRVRTFETSCSTRRLNSHADPCALPTNATWSSHAQPRFRSPSPRTSRARRDYLPQRRPPVGTALYPGRVPVWSGAVLLLGAEAVVALHRRHYRTVRNLMPSPPGRHAPAVYQIRVDGHLDTHWSAHLYDLALRLEDDGTTTLTGVVQDQSQLHGLLTKVRDLGLTLISVRVLDRTQTNATAEVVDW